MQRVAAVGTAHRAQPELPWTGGSQFFITGDRLVIGERPVIIVFERNGKIGHDRLLKVSVAGNAAKQCHYCQFMHDIGGFEAI
jgi:hypothetical protein